jgi:hypothetical protein
MTVKKASTPATSRAKGRNSKAKSTSVPGESLAPPVELLPVAESALAPVPALAASIQGSFDQCDINFIAGWVADLLDLQPRRIGVYADAGLLIDAVADEFRADLAQAGIGNGCHSFRLEPPESLFDGNEHQIEVRDLETGIIIAGSPKRFQASAHYVVGIGNSEERDDDLNHLDNLDNPGDADILPPPVATQIVFDVMVDTIASGCAVVPEQGERGLKLSMGGKALGKVELDRPRPDVQQALGLDVDQKALQMNEDIYIKISQYQTFLFRIADNSNKTKCLIENAFYNGGEIWQLGLNDKNKLQKCDEFNFTFDPVFLLEILWVCYHSAKKGATIRIVGIPKVVAADIIAGYYNLKLLQISEDVFEVVKPSPNIHKPGISFCIPAGGDTPELRKCVAKILSLKIEKEIILCGKIPETFPYYSDVKIVGEDIPYPPVWITKKKNVAVSNAQFDLVCVLHERVLLPANFGGIVETTLPFPVIGIGGLFSLTKDFDFVGRYSDFNVCIQTQDQPHFSFLSELEAGEIGEFSLSSSLMMARSCGFYYHAGRETAGRGPKYVTGSFYITQKDIHVAYGLNEALYWEDFEDVEWGMRCARRGIPHVFNTDYYQLTLAVRPMVLPPHYYLSNQEEAKLLEPIWWRRFLKNEKAIDNIEKLKVEKLVSNFSAFLVKRGLRKDLVDDLQSAINKSDVNEILVVLLGAIKTVSLGIKRYDDQLIKDVESLLCTTLERTDLGDMRCHANYFSNNFDLWDRIQKNYGFFRWVGFVKANVILELKSKKEASKPDMTTFPGKDNIYKSCVDNCAYLNSIFGLSKSPDYWYDVVSQFNGVE